MLEKLKYKIGFALVDALDWVGERMNWVPREEFDELSDINMNLLDLLHDAEREIVRLRKKCGEDYKKDYPYLL